MKTTILFLIISTILGCYGITEEEKPEEQINLLQVSPYNPADLYLIANCLIIGQALILNQEENSLLETKTPLEYYANLVHVQQQDDLLFVWNKISGKILLIIPAPALSDNLQIITDKLQKLKLEMTTFFNELIGINNMQLNEKSFKLYELSANLLAEFLGVGCEPMSLLNLDGLVLMSKIPFKKCLSCKSTNLAGLEKITDNRNLATAIASESIIIDAVGYWDVNVIFQDCAYPLKTQSDYIVGNIIGNKTLIQQIPNAIEELLNNLNETQTQTLLLNVLHRNALDLPLDKLFFELYALDLEGNETDPETTTGTPEDQTTTLSAEEDIKKSF